jgi:glycosyltransferase involved in cell wall biosynthesis
MREPQVSVIVPVYNGERFIQQSIDSALGQSISDHEVIIVNDGSTDHSAALVQDLFPTARLINQHNQGAAAARNAGIEVARGEFVAFLDCDDLWDETKLERQLELHRRYPDALASYCDHRIIDAAGRVTGKTGALDYPRWSGRILRELIQGNCIVSPSVLVARRSAVIEAGGFDCRQPAGSDDWQLSMHIAALGPILYLPETLASYRRHDANISAAWSHRKSLGNLHALESMAGIVAKLAQPRLSEIYRRALYQAYLSAGWRHRLVGDRRTAIRNYLGALKLRPWNLPLALRIALLVLLPPCLMRTSRLDD